MRYARPALFLLLATSVGTGCRTAGVDNLARREPVLPRASLDAHQVVAAHNQNAEKIQTLDATARITVRIGRNPPYPVDGLLAMERPRNFKLSIMAGHRSGEVADIGSNDEKFWFWVASNSNDPKERVSYYANYDDAGTNSLAAALQPDWLVESLGLRVFTEEEINELKVTRGTQPDTVVLTQRPTQSGGQTVIRQMIVKESTGQVIEQQLYSDKKELLAKATIASYQPVASGEGEASTETVMVPKSLRLEWKQPNRMTMDIAIIAEKTTANVVFSGPRREMFVEKPHKGYDKVNLANAARVPRGGTTEIRETLPAPPTGGSGEGANVEL
ncbi:hypothetical protein ACYOEI_15775, partial [Singulisphaera rosea]